MWCMPRKENTNYSHHFLCFIYRHILKVETQNLASPEQSMQILNAYSITVNSTKQLVRRTILRLYWADAIIIKNTHSAHYPSLPRFYP